MLNETLMQLSRFCLLMSLLMVMACTDVPAEKKESTQPEISVKESRNLFIDCDSIYPGSGLRIHMRDACPVDNSTGCYTYLFEVYKRLGNDSLVICRDTFWGLDKMIEFAHFNRDTIPDILVKSNTDVRSNWSFALYMVNRKTELTRIKGFEKIKNPNYIPDYDLIDNFVHSGRYYTIFYRIQEDSVYDLGVTCFMGIDESGVNYYEADYKEAFKRFSKVKDQKRIEAFYDSIMQYR